MGRICSHKNKLRRKKGMVFALEGIRVVEVATMAAAPMAGRFLGDWGAEVIHVEDPVTGDPWRSWWTWGGLKPPPELEYGWVEHCDRNKKSVTLDLSQETGREILSKLVQSADIFLTNRRPFELEKFSLEYDTLSRLNPRLIYASLTGFGRKGPERDAPGHDTVAFWVRSGFVYLLQQRGMAPPMAGSRTLAAGDKLTAIAVACGIILALLVRERTGVGQEVDVSLLHTAIHALREAALASGVAEDMLEREREEVYPLVNLYETKDGRWLQLCLAPPAPYWPGLCQAMERPDLEHDPRFESIEAQIENQQALFHILEEIFHSKTLEEWKPRLTEAGMLWAPVQSPREVINDPQARANDVFVPYDHPDFGRIEVVSNPIQLSKTPATVRAPAPEFSQHTEEVLLELGYSWEDIARFKEQGIIA